MSRKTNREYEREVLVERDIAPTPRECEELRIAHSPFQRQRPPPGQYDLPVKKWRWEHYREQLLFSAFQRSRNPLPGWTRAPSDHTCLRTII